VPKGTLNMRGYLQLRIHKPMIVGFGSKVIDHAMSNGVVELEAGEAGYPVLSKESSNLSSVGGQIYQYCKTSSRISLGWLLRCETIIIYA